LTLAISTSGPFAIAAWFDGNQLIERACQESRRAASSVVMTALDQHRNLEFSEIFVDVGPGSFTGVRVGVTIAKMLAELTGYPLYTILAFDLLPAETAIPSKKGEVFIRQDSQIKARAIEPSMTIATNDDWQQALLRLPRDQATPTDPLTLTPIYVNPPAISTAKQSLIMGEAFGGRRDV
jgi:tRNA A37 threonylcarbamoyladenosine modification protein TsaB